MPDLDSFFANLDLVDTSGDRMPQNSHSVPTPVDVSSTFRLLADAYTVMMRDEGREPVPGTGGPGDGLLAQLVEQLRDSADHPPRELQGVPDSFLDELERVPKKNLKESDSCPICSEAFLNGMPIFILSHRSLLTGPLQINTHSSSACRAIRTICSTMNAFAPG